MAGRVLLGITGGIAAYKAVELARILQREGCELKCILTEAAANFVGHQMLSAITGNPTYCSLWNSCGDQNSIPHIELAAWADLVAIVPATANFIAKMSWGLADDLLLSTVLAFSGPIVVAPAMNSQMWQADATRENVRRLVGRGTHLVPPGTGWLACGSEGEGRLAEPLAVADEILRHLPTRGALENKKIAITAGPTREWLDSVRFISNPSSGTMGLELARAARRMGARVHLLLAKAVPEKPPGVEVERFETHGDLEKALLSLAKAEASDLLLHSAAVGDFVPVRRGEGKLDRRKGGTSIELAPSGDIAKAFRSASPSTPMVVFSAEVGLDVERALGKMREKGADGVVVNDLSAMASRQSEVVLVDRWGRQRRLGPAPKAEIARDLLVFFSPLVLS